MKRVSKSILLAGGVIGVVMTAIELTIITAISLLISTYGIAMALSGFIQLANASSETSESILQMLLAMAISGVAIVIVSNIIFTIIEIVFVGLLISAIWAIINVSALEDKKAGYIISLVFGTLTLLGSFLLTGLVGGFVGILMMVGAIFGLVVLKKEKKVIEEEVPVK